MSDVIRVFIVDDHPVFVQGLTRLLNDEPDIVVAGVAGDARGASSRIGVASPHVALLDHRLPDQLGTELASRLRDEHPSTALVMLTAVEDEEVEAAAIDAGCTAFLRKASNVEDIVTSIRIAAAKVGRHKRPSRREVGPFGLSRREHEVLLAIARGLTAKAMSTELHLSNNTARNYTQRVLDKLGAHSKAEAVAIANRFGLLAAASRN
jgi:DNA-binding NarL/FixJ family response regulator